MLVIATQPVDAADFCGSIPQLHECCCFAISRSFTCRWITNAVSVGAGAQNQDRPTLYRSVSAQQRLPSFRPLGTQTQVQLARVAVLADDGLPGH